MGWFLSHCGWISCPVFQQFTEWSETLVKTWRKKKQIHGNKPWESFIHWSGTTLSFAQSPIWLSKCKVAKFLEESFGNGHILWSNARIVIEYNAWYIMLCRVEMDMLTMTRHILDMSPATHPPVANWSVIDSCWQVAVHVWLVLDINHCFRKCLAASSAPRYLLILCWNIKYWTRRVIFQQNLSWNSHFHSNSNFH